MTDSLALELAADTLVLDETVGIVVESLDLGWPDVRVVAAARPLADGTIDQTEHFGARAVSMAFAAIEPTGSTWKAALARLGEWLAANKRPTLVVTVDDVAYRIGLAPDQAGAPFEFPQHTRGQMTFRAPDPFLYTIGQAVSTPAYRPATTGRTYPWTPPREYPASDASSGLVDVLNGGTVSAWPRILIRGPLSGTWFAIENQTTAETFKMTTITIDAGHYLEINMRDRTVRLDGDPNIPRYQLIDFAGGSTWIRLVAGVNRLRFVTGAVTDATAEIQWADPYLWPGVVP